MVELLTIVVESFELIKVVALIVDTPMLGPKAELERMLGKIWCCHCRCRFVASRPR